MIKRHGFNPSFTSIISDIQRKIYNLFILFLVNISDHQIVVCMLLYNIL